MNTQAWKWCLSSHLTFWANKWSHFSKFQTIPLRLDDKGIWLLEPTFDHCKNIILDNYISGPSDSLDISNFMTIHRTQAGSGQSNQKLILLPSFPCWVKVCTKAFTVFSSSKLEVFIYVCKGLPKSAHRARSDHVGLGVGAATLQVLYLVKNPVDVWSLLGIWHHYGAQQHLKALWVTVHKTSRHLSSSLTFDLYLVGHNLMSDF